MKELIDKNIGRKPFRRRSLLDFIREQVHSGVWGPGEKLPPRLWFEREFQASPCTVQDAFSILLEDGVLVAEGRRGTRVCDAPPHLTRYGMVLCRPENLYIRSLLLAAEELRRTEKRNIVSYVDLDLMVDQEDHRRLMHDLEHRTLAGLFFATVPHRLLGTPILTAPGLPRVMRGGDRPEPVSYPGIVPIDTATREDTASAALAEMAAAGVRSTALLLGGDGPVPKLVAHVRKELDRRGVSCPPELLHFCNPQSPSYVESIARLIFSDANRLRPEAIFIGDDNFLPYAIRGMVEAMGEAGARRIRIYSSANVPVPEPVDFPVRYFPMDTLALLRRAIAEIDRIRGGAATAASAAAI